MSTLKMIYDNKIFAFFYGLIKSILLGIIILYLAFVIFQRISGNGSIFGYRVFTVATGSMVPVYNVDDIIVVKEVDNNSLEIGDDVAYMGEEGDFKDRLVTHRIINKETDSNGNVIYQTRGVANTADDPKINVDQIYGKVLGKLVGINLLNHVIKSQVGFFFLIFIPLVLVIFLEVADTIVEAKLDKKELEEIKKLDKKVSGDKPSKEKSNYKDSKEEKTIEKKSKEVDSKKEEKSIIDESKKEKTIDKESDQDEEII